MKKEWIRFSSFVLLFCLLFTMLNKVLAITRKSWVDFYKLPKNSVDVLFLGNSHSFDSFNPLIVDDLLPVSSYVIGIASENVVVSYYELREVLKSQHPKVVVYETYALYGPMDMTMGYLFQFMDAIGWNENKFALINRFLFPDNLYSVFPSLRTRIEWDKPYNFFSQIYYINKLSTKGIDPLRGSRPNSPRVVPDSNYQNTEKYQNTYDRELIPENLFYLDKLVSLCKENNIQLILATAPTVGQDLAQDEYSDPMDLEGYTQKNNIPWIQFEQSKFYQMHFHDLYHVNSIGSLVVSTDTAFTISQVSGIPINAEKLKNYQDFDFLGHSITQTNNEYEIKVELSDPDSPLVFQWRLLKDDEELQITDWQSSSSFEFTLESAGEYFVNFRAKNPSSGYMVEVNFPVTKE